MQDDLKTTIVVQSKLRQNLNEEYLSKGSVTPMKMFGT